jgi:hypothetical protein
VLVSKGPPDGSRKVSPPSSTLVELRVWDSLRGTLSVQVALVAQRSGWSRSVANPGRHMIVIRFTDLPVVPAYLLNFRPRDQEQCDLCFLPVKILLGHRGDNLLVPESGTSFSQLSLTNDDSSAHHPCSACRGLAVTARVRDPPELTVLGQSAEYGSWGEVTVVARLL